MPALECFQDQNGLVMVWNGVTRATRVAKLMPGATVRVEIIGVMMKKDFSLLPTVEDRLP
jgi:hypothetical protein